MTNIRTLRPFTSFAQAFNIAFEMRDDPSYRFEGRYRQVDQHCFFQYTIKGRGEYSDHKGVHAITPGKGFLCRAWDERTAYGYPADADGPWEFFWFAFRGEAASNLVEEIVARHGGIFEIPQDGHLLRPILDYRRLGGITQELDAASSARLVMDLLLGLAEMTEAGSETDSEVLLVKRAMRMVRMHLAENINASELASLLDVSREHLSRVFQAQTGSSPYRYIVREKILQACRMLKDDTTTHKEIARELGFPSVESFSRSFFRVVKMTPGRYRKYGAPPME